MPQLRLSCLCCSQLILSVSVEISSIALYLPRWSPQTSHKGNVKWLDNALLIITYWVTNVNRLAILESISVYVYTEHINIFEIIFGKAVTAFPSKFFPAVGSRWLKLLVPRCSENFSKASCRVVRTKRLLASVIWNCGVWQFKRKQLSSTLFLCCLIHTYDILTISIKPRKSAVLQYLFVYYE